MRFRYTGQTLLAPLGLYYYKARIYSPTLGRFLQTDPIGTADDMNLYAYVGNNPINANDPLGLSKIVTGPYAGMIGLGDDSLRQSEGQGKGDALVAAYKFVEKGVSYVFKNEVKKEAKQTNTQHGQQRTQEATTDPHRQIGDVNKVVQQGKKYTDSDTGNTVYVNGDRVAIYNQNGQKVTQFKNTKANTQNRVVNGKWIPE